MKYAAVPTLRDNPDAVALAVKQNVDLLTGQHKNAVPLVTLPTTATLADLIAAHNAVVNRLNGT